MKPAQIHHTTRTTDEGRTVYAVLFNGAPLCPDTGDKAGTLALARRTFNASHAPAELLAWDGDAGTETTMEAKP